MSLPIFLINFVLITVGSGKLVVKYLALEYGDFTSVTPVDASLLCDKSI